jgi:hypothetical protein
VLDPPLQPMEFESGSRQTEYSADGDHISPKPTVIRIEQLEAAVERKLTIVLAGEAKLGCGNPYMLGLY